MGVVHPVFTRAEFDRLVRMYDGDIPFELIEGEVVVTPAPRRTHGMVCAAIIVAIGDWQRETADRGSISDNFSLLSGEDSLAPDVAYWAAGREPDPNQERVEDVMPDLVVEVASPSTAANDRGPKRRSYLAAGIRELWLVDFDARTITVAGERDSEQTVSVDETLVSRALPGFAAPVRALLALDRLG